MTCAATWQQILLHGVIAFIVGAGVSYLTILILDHRRKNW